MEIVRDKQHGKGHFFLQINQQIENLRLNGYVKRRYGFIGDDKTRAAYQRAGNSDALDISVRATFVALSRTKSRLIFETELKPRNMRARLMMQTAKLGKAQLDRRYARRIEEYVHSVTGGAA